MLLHRKSTNYARITIACGALLGFLVFSKTGTFPHLRRSELSLEAGPESTNVSGNVSTSKGGLISYNGALYMPVELIAKRSSDSNSTSKSAEHYVLERLSKPVIRDRHPIGDPCRLNDQITFGCDPDLFIFFLVIVVCLVATAGMMAGLTMGLLSIDMLNLSILKLEGDPLERVAATSIMPVVSNHHLLLVTLLLWNSFANEALPIFLNKLVDEYSAVAISMTCVLFFGEIIPSAIFTGPKQLFIAARLIPVVKVLLLMTFPVAYPISRLLDCVLGSQHDVTRYKRNELKALIAMQKERIDDMEQLLSRAAPRLNRKHSSSFEESTLNVDEVTIIHGALDMANKTVADAMLPFKDVFVLDLQRTLDDDLMAQIMATGHSRIPVYEGFRENIRGLLLVKRLIVVDPVDQRKVGDIALRRPMLVHPKSALYHVLNKFQTGRSHMALVCENIDYVKKCWNQKKIMDPAKAQFVGMITIEDIIEELIQEEIEDESDLTQDICDELQHPRRNRKATPEGINKVVRLAVDKFKALGKRAKRRREHDRAAALGGEVNSHLQRRPHSPSVANKHHLHGNENPYEGVTGRRSLPEKRGSRSGARTQSLSPRKPVTVKDSWSNNVTPTTAIISSLAMGTGNLKRYSIERPRRQSSDIDLRRVAGESSPLIKKK